MVDMLDAFKQVTISIKKWVDDNKVAKVSGKGLSTNDYTAADKQKVSSIPNDLVVDDGKLYLAQDGAPITDSAVTFPVDYVTEDDVLKLIDKNGSSGLTDEQATNLAENTKSRHTHINAEVLELFSIDDQGSLLFNGESIEGIETPSASAAAIATQTVAALLDDQGATMLVSFESPTEASDPGSYFAQCIGGANVPPEEGGVRVLYAPSVDGELIYTGIFSGEQKTIKVQAGGLYIFYMDYDVMDTAYTSQFGAGIFEYFKEQILADSKLQEKITQIIDAGKYATIYDLVNYRHVSKKVPASEVSYTNDLLQDDSGTVKGALDETIALVISGDLGGDSEHTCVVDEVLSSTSTNPVQNKVINSEIENIYNTISDMVGDTSVSEQLNVALADKADTTHTHLQSDIADLSTVLDGKADVEHTHEGINSGVLGIRNAPVGNIYNYGHYIELKFGPWSTKSNIIPGQNVKIPDGTNMASGSRSNASGEGTLASGYASNAQNVVTKASGAASHAEGCETTASGAASHAEGYLTTASGTASHAGGCHTIAKDYQFALGYYNPDFSSTRIPTGVGDQSGKTLFSIGNGTSTSPNEAFAVNNNGTATLGGKAVSKGSDFAEYFEWIDGNLDNEDRRGKIVALDGDKIKLANVGDDILGVITSTGAFIGNSASLQWKDKYLTDIFGERLLQDVEIPEQVDEATGEITPAYTIKQWILNPEYDPTKEYVGREDRPEWAPVGMLGQVIVVDDGSCVVNGYCSPSTGGIGTASNNGYRVLKRIDDTHIKVLVR